MTRIQREIGGPWMNEHRSVMKFHRRRAEVHQGDGSDLAAILAERGRVLGAFITEEAARDRELCVTGSGWSQSDLYHNLSTHMDTDADEGIWEVPVDAFVAGVEEPRRYVMVTGGTKIHRLMEWLGKAGRDLSLRTAGSHKGQSLAGLVGTGSHGSTWAESGAETHVRGMLLATGDEQSTWLADPDTPILREEWVSRFAKVGDPARFADARVHLGGMGFVSAYLIEAVDEFHCGLVKRARVLPSNWFDLVGEGRFAEAVGDIAKGRTPRYYEITFDPFDGAGNEALETIWFDLAFDSKPAATGGQLAHTTLEAITERAAQGFIDVTRNPLAAGMSEARLRDLIDVPQMIFDDFRQNDACDEADVPRTLAQLTTEWHPHRLMGVRVDVYNAAFAVPRERLGEVMRIARAMAEGENNIRQFSKDFVYTVRFARKSPATMGFLRFEDNAILNIDGLPKNFILGTDAHIAAERLQHLLEKAGIPFAMHWGKDAQMGAPAILAQYGRQAVERYRATRAALLGANAEVFISPALRQWGLQDE